MNESIVNHIQNVVAYAPIWGFLIIFIFMAVESSFIPFPSEVVMIPAGFLAYRYGLSFQNPPIDLAMAVIMGTAGSLAGAYFNYYFALWLGRPILYKYGKYFFIKPQFLERSEEIFRQYGEIATFVCRLLPGIRQLISLPAGLARMSFWRFTLFTFLGAGIWTAILAFIGYYLGHIAGSMSYAELLNKSKGILSQNYVWIIVGLIIIIVVYGYIHHKIMKSSKKLGLPKNVASSAGIY